MSKLNEMNKLSILELVMQMENVQARISELGTQKDKIDSSLYKERMDYLMEEHHIIITVLINTIGGIYFKDSSFSIKDIERLMSY